MKAQKVNSAASELSLWPIVFLSGYGIGSLINIYNYFYDAKGKEGYFLLIILGVILLFRYTTKLTLSINGTYQYLLALTIIFLAVFGAQIVFYSSAYNDWSGLICMLSTAFIAMTLPWKHLVKKQLVALLVVLAGIVVGFLQMSAWLGIFIALTATVLLTYNYARILPVGQWLFSLLGIVCISLFSYLLLPDIRFFKSQNTYYDKIVFSQKTRLQQIDITEWKNHHWFYYDKVKYLSSIDEWMYFEPLVHPVMHMVTSHKRVLVVGGENGCAVRELSKYQDIEIDQIPFDEGIIELARNNELFQKVNNNIYQRSEVNLLKKEAFNHLAVNKETYDVIIVDLPDPLDIEINQFYTKEFYELCRQSLTHHGMICTQAGSPYFATKAYLSVKKTMEAGGFITTMMHNQIPSLGEWGWIIGNKHKTSDEISELIKTLEFSDVETIWLDQNALNILFSFGKMNVNEKYLKVNTLKNPVTHVLYKEGDLKID